MMYSKFRYIKKSAFLLGLVFMMLFVSGENISVQASSPKVTVSHKSNSSKKVKVVVTANDITDVSIEDFYYYANDKYYDLKKSSLNWYISGSNKVIIEYTCSEKNQGKYCIGIMIGYDEGLTDYVEAKFTYSTGKKTSTDTKTVLIGNPSRNISIGKTEFVKFYEIDESVEQNPQQPGKTYTVHVLYKGKTKTIVNSNNVLLKWGNQSFTGTVKRDQTQMDGYWHFNATFNIKTIGDNEGPLVAYYNGEKSTSKSLGVKLESDGTKPVIKIDDKYAKGKTKYVNKDVSVPITIQEKNFDASKTTVTVNGKATSVSWGGSGNTHQANVNLKEGKHVIEVSTTDKAGNKADNVKSCTIIVDKKSPKVTIEGFENGTGKGLKNGEIVPYPLKITISDETKIGSQKVQLYRLSDDGKSKTKIDLKVTTTGNKVEYSIDDLVDDGYYSLSISVFDKAGNKPEKKTVKSEGKRPYNISKGKVTGAFTVNRAGSLYVAENEEIYDKPIKVLNDIVIYEYNKNEIISHKVEIIDSISTKELGSGDYEFKKISNSDKAEYKYKYEYIIHADNFDEGYYNIQISSTSIAGKNGTLIAQTEESNSLNKTIILDKTSPEIVLFEGTSGGKIKLKLRDDNLDETSVKVVVKGKEYTLQKNEDDSTSTNIVFEGDVNTNPQGATVVCKDLAGNETKGGEIVIQKDSILKNVLIYGGLALGALVLIVGTIVIVVVINRRKK